MRILPIESAALAVRASLLPARKVTVCGEGAWALGVQLAAQAACEGGQVLYLCGDNRFDPYAVARVARSEGLAAEKALERILVARAFTGWQLDELIHRLDPGEADGLVIVSGIVSAFLDEDLNDNDAARLFYRTLWRLGDLSPAGPALLLTQSPMPAKTPRAYFLKDLCRASNVVLRLEGRHSFTLEQHPRMRLSVP